MNKKDLWNLFRLTGKIEYYLKYKEEDKNELRRSNGDNSKWNKLWRNK